MPNRTPLRVLIAAAALSPAALWAAPAADRAALTTNLVFASAARIADKEAAHDTEVRQLLGRIRTAQQALGREKGSSAALRGQLTALKKQLNDRLASVNATFALERAAFVRAIEGLIESEDPRLQQALERLAAGDTAALDQIGALVRAGSTAGDAGIVLRRGYAALLTDAVLRGEREKSAAIAEWEAVLRASPGDTTALNRLTWLYADSGRMADAERVAAQGAAQHQHAFLRALALQSQGNLALRGGDYGRGAAAFAQAVALLQPIADPSSADARRVREIGKTAKDRERAEYDYVLWIHVPIAGCLRDLSRAELKLGRLAAAQAHAAESVANGMKVTDAMTAANRQVEAYWAYFGSYLEQQAQVQLALGDPAAALETYKRAIAANLHEGPSAVPGTRIDAAGAAIAAKRLPEATTLLAGAKADLATLKPSAWSVGTEGLYWEQIAALASAQGSAADAKQALNRAELALAQAAKAEPTGYYDWPTHLARIRTRAAAM